MHAQIRKKYLFVEYITPNTDTDWWESLSFEKVSRNLLPVTVSTIAFVR